MKGVPADRRARGDPNFSDTVSGRVRGGKKTNKDHPPPNETGRSDDPARLKSAVTTDRIIEQPREVNPAATSWAKEGCRLIREYQKTGNPKHFDAFWRHFLGIRSRMGSLPPKMSTEEALP
jgi:hypothetical protein